MQPSDRLRKVLELGDVLALFPLLKDWPTEELQALLKDVDELSAVSHAEIDEAWQAMAFDPAVFMNKTMSRQADRVRDNRKRDLLIAASEICSVVFYYLDERGIGIED